MAGRGERRVRRRATSSRPSRPTRPSSTSRPRRTASSCKPLVADGHRGRGRRPDRRAGRARRDGRRHRRAARRRSASTRRPPRRPERRRTPLTGAARRRSRRRRPPRLRRGRRTAAGRGGFRQPAGPPARRARPGCWSPTCAGTGPGGRIVRRDVEAALAQRVAHEEADSTTRARRVRRLRPHRRPPVGSGGAGRRRRSPTCRTRRMRRAVAARLTESKQTIPHFYVRATVRVDELLQLRADLNDGADVRVSVNDLRAQGRRAGAPAVPGDERRLDAATPSASFSGVDVAVAVATDTGPGHPGAARASSGCRSPTVAARDRRTSPPAAARAGCSRTELEGGTHQPSPTSACTASRSSPRSSTRRRRRSSPSAPRRRSRWSSTGRLEVGDGAARDAVGRPPAGRRRDRRRVDGRVRHRRGGAGSACWCEACWSEARGPTRSARVHQGPRPLRARLRRSRALVPAAEVGAGDVGAGHDRDGDQRAEDAGDQQAGGDATAPPPAGARGPPGPAAAAAGRAPPAA